MITIADYDALLTAIYEAGEGRRPLGAMLSPVMRQLDAVSVGFLVYDESGSDITHGIIVPVQAVALGRARQLGSTYDDAGIRAISRVPLREPRRFTDVVPPARLRSAGWFRRQEALTGVGYGIAVDLDLAGLRVRMFGMRAAGDTDFGPEPLDLLGRIARHVERAFAGAAHRLAPHAQDPDVSALVFREQDFAAPMRGQQPLERRLADRYGLTPAEARVAMAAAEGRARAETAERLGISLNSLKTHLRRVHAKLGISKAGELVRAVAMVEHQAN